MHRVEQQRGRDWVLLKAFDSEPAAVVFYDRVRLDFPHWTIRRITVHEQHPCEPESS